MVNQSARRLSHSAQLCAKYTQTWVPFVPVSTANSVWDVGGRAVQPFLYCQLLSHSDDKEPSSKEGLSVNNKAVFL